MKRRRMKKFSLFIFFNILIITISGQSKTELKETFVEAESYFLFDEFTEALPLYLKLLNVYPENANYKYRIGVCYLNIPAEKDKAIKFLEEATKVINLKYREGSFREVAAPLDSYYFLGDAYRINNRLNKAIETYQYFRDNLNPKDYDPAIVEYQIQTCRNAIKLEKVPLFLSSVNLGSSINTRFSDYNPVVSGDEKTLVYTQKLQFYDAVFYSKKVDGKWTNPINLATSLSVDQDFYSTSLSYDGKTLYLYKNDEYDGNIYVSRLINNEWSAVEKLNENINTKYWESHASESKDGNTLYFTSNRKGGLGGLDIYKSERDSTGAWGPAINLGPSINTGQNEETPFIIHDDQVLYFSSRGHYSMGGYDIFYSSLFEDGEWSAPLNMGYPINTTDDDKFYMPVGEGHFAYYSFFAESGYGNMDIFKLEIFSDEHPRKFRVKGIVNLNQKPVGFTEKIFVHITDSDKNDTVNSLMASDSGEYNFVIEAGEYDLNFISEGFEPYSKHLSLPMNNADSIVIVPTTTLSLIDIIAELSLKDSVVNMDNDTVKIELGVEPGSILLVNIYADTILISSEEFYITDSLYTYSFIPEPGFTRIEFILTDKYGNTGRNELLLPVPVYVGLDQYLAEIEEEVIEDFIVEEIVLEETLVDSSMVVKATEVKVFKERLAEKAEGGLKETLDNLDPEKEEIYSTYELISFLCDNAELLGYTEEELAVLLALIASNGNTDVNEFKTSFSPFTSGGLKTALDDVNLGKKRIKSIEDLILDLLKNKANYNFTSFNLMNALINMISELDIDMAKVKDYINEDEKEGQGKAGKVLIWVLGLAGTFIIFLLYWKRKKKDDR